MLRHRSHQLEEESNPAEAKAKLLSRNNNKISSRKSNVAWPEPSYSLTARPEYLSAAEAQENDFTYNYVKVINTFKKEMNKYLKEIQDNTFKWMKNE